MSHVTLAPIPHVSSQKPWRVWRSPSIQYGVLSCLLWAIFGVAGCSSEAKKETGPTGTVSGVVTLKGQPLTTGRLNFTNIEGQAGGSGAIGEGGAYKLDEPLPVGDYDVFVSFEFSPDALKSGTTEVLKTIPKKYRAAKTSKLEAKVKEGENKFDFTLK